MERTLLLKVPEDVYETLVKTAEEMEQPHKELAYLLKKLGQELQSCTEDAQRAPRMLCVALCLLCESLCPLTTPRY